MTGGKTSTRVQAAPGGSSSFSLGWGGGEDTTSRDRRREGSNKFASGANQNSGNFITDTPTTKVHAPPGGRSSISFGSNVAESVCDRSSASRSTRYTARSSVCGSEISESLYNRSTTGRSKRDDASCAESSISMRDMNRRPREGHKGSARSSVCGSDVSESICNRSTTGRSRRDDVSCAESSISMRDMSRRPREGHKGYARSSVCGSEVSDSLCDRSTATGYSRGSASYADSTAMRNAEFGRRPREGSNRFANGANQNSGNFITDTPTTKVIAPPGGSSSIRFG